MKKSWSTDGHLTLKASARSFRVTHSRQPPEVFSKQSAAIYKEMNE